MSKYNTNLASEFYVLSMLYRIGAEASLTLGKKTVDIIVSLSDSKTLTIGVKGLAGPYDWPADNIRLPTVDTHTTLFWLPLTEKWLIPFTHQRYGLCRLMTSKITSRSLGPERMSPEH